MFTNLMLHLCQSDCLCRCQMYPFNAFYVTYMVVITNDILQCSTCERIRLAFQSLCYMYIWPFFSCFHSGKCRLLYFYIKISIKDPIFTFSLQPGSGGKTFPDILCDCCCSWAQHNIGNSTSNVEETPSSVV